MLSHLSEADYSAPSTFFFFLLVPWDSSQESGLSLFRHYLKRYPIFF